MRIISRKFLGELDLTEVQITPLYSKCLKLAFLVNGFTFHALERVNCYSAPAEIQLFLNFLLLTIFKKVAMRMGGFI